MRSALIGISIAAPVGAIGVLVIRRTLAYGRLNGLVSGLGAATADGIYGAIAALGLTTLTTFLTDVSPLLRLVGGLFLLYLGIKTFRTPPPSTENPLSDSPTLWGAYLSTLGLTLTNPMTILAFLGIFSALGVGDGSPVSGILTVAGVVFGSGVWWVCLSWGVGLVRRRFTPYWMMWVNRASGALIVLFALFILRG